MRQINPGLGGGAGKNECLVGFSEWWLRAVLNRRYPSTNLRHMRLFHLAYPDLLGPEIQRSVRDDSDAGSAQTPKRRKTASTRRLNPGLS